LRCGAEFACALRGRMFDTRFKESTEGTEKNQHPSASDFMAGMKGPRILN
jgi:hypothetical protein